jgi:hypothetical protein
MKVYNNDLLKSPHRKTVFEAKTLPSEKKIPDFGVSKTVFVVGTTYCSFKHMYERVI